MWQKVIARFRRAQPAALPTCLIPSRSFPPTGNPQPGRASPFHRGYLAGTRGGCPNPFERGTTAFSMRAMGVSSAHEDRMKPARTTR